MLQDIKLAVENNNIKEARKILTNEILGKDCDLNKFQEALDYGSECNLFEVHDDEQFLPDRKDWTLEYVEKLKNDLDNNFSKERLSRLYFISKGIKNITESNEKGINYSGSNDYKDFSYYTKICATAAVISVTALAAGFFIYSRSKKK